MTNEQLAVMLMTTNRRIIDEIEYIGKQYPDLEKIPMINPLTGAKYDGIPCVFAGVHEIAGELAEQAELLTKNE